jgi:hypothetical protein
MSLSGSNAFNATEQIVISIGNETLYEGELLPTIWWLTLVMGSCINLILLLKRLANVGQDIYARKMTYCAAAFVVACSIRSIWPRVDVERICFWDSRISVTFVGRCVATVAEICFAAQFSMTIGVLAKEVKFTRTQKMADVWFWAICIAQCCCWMGVTTKRQVWHGIEESIWALTFTGIAISFAVLYWNLRKESEGSSVLSELCKKGDLGYVNRYLLLGFPGCVAYVTFMVLVDVPMYMNRYWADQARGASYLWVSDGLLNTMSCDRVSRSMSDWAPEMPWMTGYFLGATLASLWMSWGPKTNCQDRNVCHATEKKSS